MSGLVLITVSFVAGLAARSIKTFPENTHLSLNAFIINISLPALIIVRVAKMEFRPELIWMAAMPWIIFLGGGVFFFSLKRILRFSSATLWTLILVAGLGNTSFLGFPLVEYHLGKDALAGAIISDQLGSFLILATIGSFIVASHSSSTGKPKPLRKLLTFPPFIALWMGALLHPFSLPGWFEEPLEIIGSTLTPLALFATAFQLRLSQIPGNRLTLTFALSWKLLLAPGIIAFLYYPILSNSALLYKTAVLEAAMGPMITAALLATASRMNAPLAILLIGLGTPLSLASSWLWIYFLH